MPPQINFVALFEQLRAWFDSPTPTYCDFDGWRRQCYVDVEMGRRRNLPLKTWWPRYTNGDSRVELCVGSLLVHQTNWASVKACIVNIDQYLKQQEGVFDLEGLLSVATPQLEELVRPSGYFRQKTARIQRFCRHVRDHSGTMGQFIETNTPADLERALAALKAGFGPETRHAVILYAAHSPRFIADAYARRLLRHLGLMESDSYWECQRVFEEGIQRDFDEAYLYSLAEEYTPEECHYALNGVALSAESAFVMLYQQFHAGIVELGISKRIDEFVRELLAK